MCHYQNTKFKKNKKLKKLNKMFYFFFFFFVILWVYFILKVIATLNQTLVISTLKVFFPLFS